MVLVEEIHSCTTTASSSDSEPDSGGGGGPTMSRCVTRSMSASINQERKTHPNSAAEENNSNLCYTKLTTIKTRERTKRSRCTSRRKIRNNKKKKYTVNESRIELTDLSEEVLIAILEHVPATGLVSMSKTSWLFHRICHTDTLWKHRCKIDFNLQTKWAEFSHLYLYEMFFKANTLRDDQNFFKPVSQLKTSVIVWYLTNPSPPCHVVGHLTASQVKSIWSITEEELEEMYFDDSEDRPDMFPLCHYDWSRLYQVFLRKHGGVIPMQNYVLKRCFRNRVALEDHYKLSLHASRRQKWYQYLEDRDVGNREALKALTEHMPKVTYIYMLHQITAMYIEGNLKGGFQTVKAYAEFCGKFRSWMEEKSMKLWPPRIGEILAQDYRIALDFVNKCLASEAEERELDVESFMSKACPFVQMLHEVWTWQNQHGTAYRKEHRSSMIVRRHECYRKYLEFGRAEDFRKLRMYFERREVLSHWLKENLWLISVLGEGVVRSLRPPMLAPDYSFPVLGTDQVACLVQRFLETGLFSDFNKIRMKLSELSSMQIHGLFKKSQALELSIMNEMNRPDSFTLNETNRIQQQKPFPPHGRPQHMAPHTGLHPQPAPISTGGASSHMFYPPHQHNRFFQCQSHPFR
ncbi:uncharacterized protein [Clytia hemisphaerica]|uniref:F-box domain-containing protein n=1 Tax=Clytia hemisphaerica TaxID=252671 RepID=A0A7M6DKK7_9CNID